MSPFRTRLLALVVSLLLVPLSACSDKSGPTTPTGIDPTARGQLTVRLADRPGAVAAARFFDAWRARRSSESRNALRARSSSLQSVNGLPDSLENPQVPLEQLQSLSVLEADEIVWLHRGAWRDRRLR